MDQSYAEYFLAKTTFYKLKEKKDDDEVNQVLKKKQFFLVRNFLEGFLQKHPLVIKSNESEETTFTITNTIRTIDGVLRRRIQIV